MKKMCLLKKKCLLKICLIEDVNTTTIRLPRLWLSFFLFWSRDHNPADCSDRYNQIIYPKMENKHGRLDRKIHLNLCTQKEYSIFNAKTRIPKETKMYTSIHPVGTQRHIDVKTASI